MSLTSGGSERLVVIAGAESVTALITARSIKQLRYKIIGVTTDLSLSPTRSTLWSELHLTRPDMESYRRQLLELGAKLTEKRSTGKPVLIVAQDPLVQLVADHSLELAQFYEFVMPDVEAVNRLLDKTVFHAWAVEQGFPVPASTIVESLPALDAALERGPYPLIVKPLVRTAAWDGPFPALKFFTLADRASSFEHREHLFEYSPRYVVQQWIPGDDEEVYFCLAYFDRQGQPRAWYTGRKILQWPLRTGSTAICIGTDAPEFEQMSLDLLRRGGLKGLGSVEAKRNPLDGRFYVTEPTVGRNDFQSYLATVAGVNLSAYAALDALHLPLPEFERGRAAVWFDELGAFRALRANGEPGKIFRMIRESGCRLNAGAALFSWSDAAPALHRFAGEVRQGVRRLRRRHSGSRHALQTEHAEGPPQESNAITVRLWSEEEFLRNRHTWDRLLASSDCDPLFLSWLWQANWWRTFGSAHGLELRLFAAYRGQALVGLAPMFLNVSRQRRLNIQRLQSIGNIWRGPMTMRTEYLDLITHREYRTEATRTLMQAMVEQSGWDEMILSDLDTKSATYDLLRNGSIDASVRIPTRYDSYEIRCDRSFQNYVSTLSQNARRKLYGQRQRLQQLGEIQLVQYRRTEFDMFARVLNELHESRWGRPFFVGLMAEFHRQLIDAIETIGAARLSVMSVAGRPVSAMYSLIVAGREYHLQGGFNAQIAPSLSLGKLHLGYSIERAFDERVETVDLLVGGGRSTDFKRHFAQPVPRSCLVQLVRSKRLRLGYSLLDALRSLRARPGPQP